MAMLENDIYESTYKASIDPEIHLTNAKKIEHENAFCTYRDSMSWLESQQGQAL